MEVFFIIPSIGRDSLIDTIQSLSNLTDFRERTLKDVIVQLFDNSSNDTVFADVLRSIAGKSTPNDWVQISFASAPASNDIRVLVIKCA